MADTTEQWTLMQDGSTLITFTSMLEVAGQFDSSVPEEALEEGSFAAYNRTQYSDVFNVKLAIEGDSPELQEAQETLDKLKTGTETFSLVTPDFEHENLALESYNYSRTNANGNGLLIVDLRLKKIREVTTGTATLTVASCKNASNASKQQTGRTQTSSVSSDGKTSKSMTQQSSILSNVISGGGS